MVNKYSFKEAWKIHFSRCGSWNKGKFRYYTLTDILILVFVFYFTIPMIILLWWFPVRNIMKKGVSKKDREAYLYFKK